MKVAILHNYLDNIGGAQVALFTLAAELEADVYSTAVNQKAIELMGFKQKVTSIGWIPTNAPWRHQAAVMRFARLNLTRNYDAFIIAGDWALAAAIHNRPNIWWCHSPSRELWDLYDRTRITSVPWHKRPLYDLWVRYNRHLNRQHIKRVTKVFASSRNSQDRLKRYLNCDASIIYPPVNAQAFYHGESQGYWLSVNRLVHYKQVELQLEAWATMPERRLVIVGADEPARHFQQYKKQLLALKPPNVTFLPPQTSDKLRDLYAHAEGFVTTSHNEDFGLTAVEAMAAGKPVVAVNEGGYQETVVHGITGYLIDPTVSALTQAVSKVASDPTRYTAACIERAKLFDTATTVAQFTEQLEQLVQER